MPARLVITDGTVEINLLDRSFGFHLSSWEPAIAQYKQGGTFSDSPLADGRRLVDSHFENVFETFELKANSLSQDSLIRDTQELRRLLEKGASYWTANWQNEPVWIEARASQETNLRYSLVVAGSIASDDDPFQMPFLQPDCTAVMDELDLVVEREPFWRANVPGEGPCVEITGSQDYTVSWFLTFNGTTSRVQVTAGVLIRNLPTSLFSQTMTVDGWIDPDGWGENNEGRILDKTASGNTGWWFGITSTGGLEALIYHADQDAWSRSGLDDYVLDGLWHHVAFTWEVATGLIRLWIDGIEVSYATQQPAVGIYSVDLGDDLFIGNRSDNARTFDGDMGWVRITEGLRWAANFTAPERCVLPFIDGPAPPLDTIAQWIGVEGSGATIDNQQGAVALDGTQTDCIFDDCVFTYGRAVETCLDEVYIANKHNIANITHIFQWSANWGFSANLQGAALPYDLIEIAGAAPAVDDYVAFGIATTLADSGPFSSLVFDIGTAIGGMTADDWEYSDGVGPTWTDLAAEQDNTNQNGLHGGSAFDTTGVGSVHWVPDPLWTAEDLNGVTAYWVRVVVTAAPGAHVAPTQQLRDVYSIVWPYIEADELQIAGDVTSLLQFNYKNRSDHDGGGGVPPNAWANRVIAGIRSNVRGTGFTPFINCAQEQNPLGIAVTTVGAGQIFQVDPTAPAGWHIQTTNPASTEGFLVRFTQPALDQYRGTYRVFMRGDITAGGVGDQRFRLMIREPIYWEGEFRQFETTDDWSYIDFGEFTFPPTYPGQDPDEQMAYVDLTIEAEVFFAGFTCRFYDLIMFPVDEWTGDFIRSAPAIAKNSASSIAGPGLDAGPFTDIGPLFLNVDSVGFPKMSIKAYTETDSYVWSRYLSISAGPAILQANADQRLFFLAFRYEDTGRVWTSEPWISASLQLTHVDRYLSMRGAR